MFWQPRASAPRSIKELSIYVDQQLGELSQALDTFDVFPVEYVPEWTHSDSTNPAIGNGTLNAHAIRFGGMAIVQLHLIIGSTTTFEATASPGNWRFSVPWACQSFANGRHAGSALLFDSGTQWFNGNTWIGDGDSFFSVVANDANSHIRKTVPMTWATSDILAATIVYPVRD